MTKEQKYLLHLEETLQRHIKELEEEKKVMIAEQRDDWEVAFKAGQIDSFRFILKNMKFAGVGK